jgi:hypothetical protein
MFNHISTKIITDAATYMSEDRNSSKERMLPSLTFTKIKI